MTKNLASTIAYVASHQATIAAERAALVAKWRQRAVALRSKSLEFLKALQVANQRILIRGEALGEFRVAVPKPISIFGYILRRIGPVSTNRPQGPSPHLPEVEKKKQTTAALMRP